MGSEVSGGVECELPLDPYRGRGWLQESGVEERVPGCRYNWAVSVWTVFTMAGSLLGDLVGLGARSDRQHSVASAAAFATATERVPRAGLGPGPQLTDTHKGGGTEDDSKVQRDQEVT